MAKGCKIINQDCDPTLAEDKTLPYTSFLVEYLHDGMTKFDIAVGSKQVDIFDDYWDKYRNNFINMTQTQGRVNPKNWDDPTIKKKK